MIEMMYYYMKDHLSIDAYMKCEVVLTPPPYIKKRIKKNGRITNLLLVEFFDMPKTNASVKYISELRSDIQYWEDRAKEELKY